MKTPLARGYKRERGTKSKRLEKFLGEEGIEGEILGNTRCKRKFGESCERRPREAKPGEA